MIDYKVLNKIRQRFLPFYILALIFSLVYFAFIIFNLITLSPKDNLLYYCLYMGFSFLGIIGAVSIITQLINWYEDKILSVLKPMYLDKFLQDKYGLSFTKKANTLFKNSLLIGQHHRYKTRTVLENDNFILQDIVMLSGLRFNGYALTSKNITSDQTNFIITNHHYYYHHRPKGYLRNKDVPKPFLHKCKLLQNEKHSYASQNLNQILPLTAGFKHLGFSRIAGQNFVLFSFREKDGANLFIPSILEKFDTKYETTLEANLSRIIKLLTVNLD